MSWSALRALVGAVVLAAASLLVPSALAAGAGAPAGTVVTAPDPTSETGDTVGDPGEDTDGPTQDISDQEGEAGMPIWVWILVGVAVIGALLGALVGGTRRRDEERGPGT
jgi:cobalamin biosynthesis Mg chelatase CobN